MEKLKLTHELMASLVDVLPETMTLSELKGIRNALQSTVNNHESTITNSISTTEQLSEKSIMDIMVPEKSETKPIKLPIQITSIMEPELAHLANFINLNMINCEEISKECVIAGTFYKVYSACREKSGQSFLHSRDITSLMGKLGFFKFKNWECERWPGIKFINPELNTMFKNKVKKPKVVKQ